MLRSLLIILSVGLSFVSAGDIYNAGLESYRLPNQTFPENYTVQLVFQNIEQDINYSGTVQIVIKILEDVETITFHSSVLNISEFTPLGEFENVPLSYTLDEVREFIIIRRNDSDNFKNNMKIKIRIGFIGKIEESPIHQGVYRGSYYDENSVKK